MLVELSVIDWSHQLVEQLDWHWRHQLRPRLDGLSDAEYLWEPVPGAWNVRPRGTSIAPMAAGGGEFTLDFEFPEPDPPPVTTIAWRLGHLVVGVLGMRVANHFGGPPCDYLSHPYSGDAVGALAQLDENYAAGSLRCAGSMRRGWRGPAVRPKDYSRECRWPRWSCTSTGR